MLRIFITLCFYVCGLSVLFASTDKQIVIRGKIDTEDGEPVFATVFLKNTTKGTMTSPDGHYSLEVVPGKHTLAVSAIGYKPEEREIDVAQDGCTYDFMLRTDVAQLAEVTVVAKSEGRRQREKGFALSTVDTKKAVLKNLGTAELLNRTAGVKLRQSGGVGSDVQYNINGMSGNAVRIFIDGVPMENYGSSFSVSSLPPSAIERIDVYKGVVPAHLTDDALGGAINIILKQPANTSVATSYAYGSFNTHKWDLNASHRSAGSGFTVHGSGFFNHSDNNYKVWGDAVKVTDPQTGKLEHVMAERFHDTYRSKGVQLNTGFTNVKWADRFLMGFIYSDMQKDIQHGATMDVVYGNRRSEQYTLMGKWLYEKKDLLPGLDLSANLSYASGHRTVIDTVPFMFTWLGTVMTDRNGNPIQWNKGGGEAGKATLATNLEKTLTGRMRLAYEFLPSQVLSGNILYNRFARDVKDPFLTEAEQRFTDTRHLDKMVLGLSYDGRFWDERLQTSLFYKHYRQWVRLTDPVMKEGELIPEQISRNTKDHGFGGTLALRLSPHVTLTASAEYAMRMPGVTELLGNTSNNIQATYDLRPEKSTNLNVGALFGTFRWKRHELDADVNLFYRDIKDMIQKSLTNLTDEMYGYENLGKIKSKGVDLDLRYRYDHRLTSEFRLSYTDARFNLRYDTHGTEYIYYKDRLRNAPFFTFNWDSEYLVHDWLQKGSRISFSYSMGYVHRFFRNWESLGGAGKAIIPTQWVHDIGVLYTFPHKRFSIGVDCKNLFNEQVFDNWALQKPGRMVLMKLSYSFVK